MVDGVNSTSTYVPNIYSSSSDSYAGYVGGNYSYPNDSVEFSTQQKQNTSSRNKLLAVAGAALVLIGGVVFRKDLPIIGKYFKEGGGGATKAVEEGVGKVKGIFGKGVENAEINSFAKHNELIKEAEKNLEKITDLKNAGKASKAEENVAKATLQAAKDAKAATEKFYTGDIEKAINAKNELAASKGNYTTPDQIKEYTAKLSECDANIKTAKEAYKTALTEGNANTASQANKIVSNTVNEINTGISEEKTSLKSIKDAAKLQRSGDKTAQTKAVSARIDHLAKQVTTANGGKELTEEQFKSIKSQAISEMRAAFHEYDVAAAAKKAGKAASA